MEEGMKALNIAAKVLAWRSNAMWSILLAIGEAAKALAGNVLTTKSLRLLSVYIGTRKTRCPRASLRTIGGGLLFRVWTGGRDIHGKKQIWHCYQGRGTDGDVNPK